MGQQFRILDYKNGRIVSGLKSTQEVCAALKAVFVFSDSFAVITTSDQFVTQDFVQNQYGDWAYMPAPKEA